MSIFSFKLSGDVVIKTVAFIIVIGLLIGITQTIASGFKKGLNFFGLFCIWGCSETTIDPGPTISKRLIEQSWILSARTTYNFPQIYITQTSGGVIIPDPEINYNAYVDVTAGVNLDLFSPTEDVVYDDGVVTLTIPSPQIIDCILDIDVSYFYNIENCDVLGMPLGYTCEELKHQVQIQALDLAANADHTELLELAFLSAKNDIEKILAGIDDVEQIRIIQNDAAIPVIADGGTCKPYENQGN